ncbi:hypothetical protein C2W62_23685 [Candidatus Entotheonella serta]|nr:hypothetical protein C2W62_23685 [Candidatus Entotheonella serta]
MLCCPQRLSLLSAWLSSAKFTSPRSPPLLVVEKVKPFKQWFVDKYGDCWLELLEGAIEKAQAEIAAEDATVLK